jgi:hypothetical protein
MPEAALILGVDEAPDGRLMYAMYLRHHGYRVIDAINSVEAIEQASGLPDVLTVARELLKLSAGPRGGLERVQRRLDEPPRLSSPRCASRAPTEPRYSADTDTIVPKSLDTVALARKAVLAKALVKTQWNVRKPPAVRDVLSSALAAHPDLHLIVWPETAYNHWLPRDQRNMRDAVTGGIDRPMIWGALTYRRRPNGDPYAFNTAFLTSTSGDVLARYDEIELLLFGERISL